MPDLKIPSGLPLLLDRLRRALGPEHVDDSTRPHIRCAPASPAEVAEVVAAAAVAGVRLSAAESPAALLHLSLHRMTTVLSVDQTSLLVEAQAGVTLRALQAHLRPLGLGLGPLPAPSLSRTLGAALSAPRPAEASPALGRLRDRAARIYGVLPEAGGEREMALPLMLAPRRAAGPDLKQLLIGARGRTGILTSASLPVVRRAAHSRCAGWSFAPEKAGRADAAISVLCRLLRAHGGIGPTDIQVLSREQVARIAPNAVVPEGGAALLLRADGPSPVVEATLLGAGAACAAAGGHGLPEALCQAWLAPETAESSDGPDSPDATLAAEALWPVHQQALPLSSAALGAAFAAGGGPRVLCGVHLHGAALCRPDPIPAAAPAGPDPQEALLAAVLGQLDPRGVLC